MRTPHMPLDALPATRLDALAGTASHGYAARAKAGRGTVPQQTTQETLLCGSVRWFCVQTHPQAEQWACDNLRRQGYQTYLPMHSVQVRDRVLPTLWHTTIQPLWKGYAFVQFSSLDPWHPIQSSYGVRRLVGFPNPAPCPSRVVEALQAGEELRRTLTPREPLWRPGAACKLSDGAFQGHAAVVTAVHHDRALVALLMLGHLREVQVSLGCLVARE